MVKYVWPLTLFYPTLKVSLAVLDYKHERLCCYTSHTVWSRWRSKQVCLTLVWKHNKLKWLGLSTRPGALQMHSVSVVSYELFCLNPIHSLGLWWRLTGLILLRALAVRWVNQRIHMSCCTKVLYVLKYNQVWRVSGITHGWVRESKTITGHLLFFFLAMLI